MSGEPLAAALRASGLDDAEIPGKLRLFGLATQAFARLSGADPVAAWWVPGRLEVFGTHTDYAGGRTLVAAVPRGFAFLAAPRSDRRVRVIDAVAGEDVLIDPAASPDLWRGWRRYAAVVASRLARNFPGAEVAADVVLGSDLPRAGGVSSSSALVVGLATALAETSHLREHPTWTAALPAPHDEAGYFACLENGLDFGPLAGDGGVGVHGGSEDHAAIVHATAGHVSAWSFVPMRHLEDVAVPAGWTFVVAESGVAAAKAGAARERYNRLAAGARALHRLAALDAPGAPSLAAALAASDAVGRLRRRLRDHPVDGWSARDIDDRLTHFVHEDARVGAACQAFRTADANALGALAAASQAEAETRLRNQTAETCALTRAALETGALAARNFGAGFGGSAWALVSRDEAEAFRRRWLDAYRRAGYAHLASAAFEARPAPARTRLL